MAPWDWIFAADRLFLAVLFHPAQVEVYRIGIYDLCDRLVLGESKWAAAKIQRVRMQGSAS
jgi:hypothetical protein